MRLYKVDTGKTYKYGILYVYANSICESVEKVKTHMTKEHNASEAEEDIKAVVSVTLLTESVIL